MKEGDVCPFCSQKKERHLLEYCPADEPWSDEHLICPNCLGSYNIEKDTNDNN